MSNETTGLLPIDTAPRDGREVLGFGTLIGHAEGQRIFLPMRWDWWGGGVGVPGFSVRITEHVFEPTHWMPLPAIPESQ